VVVRSWLAGAAGLLAAGRSRLLRPRLGRFSAGCSLPRDSLSLARIRR
jgi:hypothetical protein